MDTRYPCAKCSMPRDSFESACHSCGWSPASTEDVHQWSTLIRISSSLTFFYKRVFPVIWFAMLSSFGIGTFAQPPHVVDWPAVVVCVFCVIISYVVMRLYIFDLVDEVWDGGNHLIVRNGGQEERIALSDCLNLSYSGFVNPPRVTLLLRRPSHFGVEIKFIPPYSVFPYSMPTIARQLIARIDEARRAPDA